MAVAQRHPEEAITRLTERVERGFTNAATACLERTQDLTQLEDRPVLSSIPKSTASRCDDQYYGTLQRAIMPGKLTQEIMKSMATLIANPPQQQSYSLSSVVKDIRIIIIDDHVLVRNGLRMLLESHDGMRIVGEASHAAEALTTVISAQPDIILLDVDVAKDLDLLPEFYRIVPEVRVIVLTGMRDLASHRRAVRLGAVGLVRKEQASEVLLQAIAKVHAGEVWLERTLLAEVLGEMTRGGPVQPIDPEAARIATLTPRERELITLVGEGLKNQQIARRLCIAEATVRHHLTSIFAKLNVVDRLELAIYAYRHGLFRIPP